MRNWTLDRKARVIGEAMYFVAHNATVRQTAQAFGVSKSTIHVDLVRHYPQIIKELPRFKKMFYPEPDTVLRILSINKQERATRGGEATRQMYLKKSKTQKKEE